MKAVYFEQTGGPEVLQYGALPDPVPAADEVLVDIHAASVNAADWKTRSGRYRAIPAFPWVPGRDFSGVVAAVGAEVADLSVGTPVFGVCEAAHDGAYAEKIAINAGKVARKPDSLSHVQAVAMALVGLTCVVSLEHTLALQPGERILVQGGAGGVGGFAVQLAHHLGATVVTTASAHNHDYVRRLGADVVIDYRNDDFVERAGICDAVFDTVGGTVAERAFDVLRAGGRAAFIASGVEATPSPRNDVTSLRPRVERKAVHLERVMELVENGAVVLPEITTFKLAEAATAHAVSESRHLRGKLVLQVRE